MLNLGFSFYVIWMYLKLIARVNLAWDQLILMFVQLCICRTFSGAIPGSNWKLCYVRGLCYFGITFPGVRLQRIEKPPDESNWLINPSVLLPCRSWQDNSLVINMFPSTYRRKSTLLSTYAVFVFMSSRIRAQIHKKQINFHFFTKTRLQKALAIL